LSTAIIIEEFCPTEDERGIVRRARNEEENLEKREKVG
jgi:hypothetical protein